MHPDAQAVVDLLQLAPHPEGGFFRETFRSRLVLGALPGAHLGESFGPTWRSRAASTAIYYLLPSGAFSALHRVRSDEVWHFYGGEPLTLHAIDDVGVHCALRLGPSLERGEVPQAVVAAGCWQAAVPDGPRYSLVGCTVAPGFDFADFQMPPRAELLARFPQHRAVIEQLTRAPI